MTAKEIRTSVTDIFLNKFRFDCRWVCRFFYRHRRGPHAPVQRRDHLLLLSEA